MQNVIDQAAHLAHRTRLTDPQYAAIDAAAERGDSELLRGEDVTEATLRSLARKRYARLEIRKVGLRPVVVSAHLNAAGWAAYRAERDRREVEAERVAALAAVPTPRVEVDPFAVHRDRQYWQDRAIDEAFAF